jgi:hypothetical protein
LRYTAGNPIPNPVINSAFQVWQRGTSIVGTGAVGYSADRWATNINSSFTISRQVTNDTTNLPNVQYCMRFQRNSGSTNTTNVSTTNNFETINSIPFVGKTVTWSFYARKGANFSGGSSQITAALITGTGTDQNYNSGTYTGAQFPVLSYPTLTTGWQRFTYTATLSTAMTEMALYFDFNTPSGTAGAADYFEVTGVQIDIGSVALPFRTNGATIQGELAACQRYYYRQTPSTSYGWVGYGVASGTTGGAIGTTFPVQMRTTPSAVEYSTLSVSDASSAVAVTSLTLDTSVASANVGVCNFGVASGLTAYRPYYLRQNANNAGYLAYTAEL